MKYFFIIFCFFSFVYAYPSLDPDVLNQKDNDTKVQKTSLTQKNSQIYIILGVKFSKINLINNVKDEYLTEGSSDSTSTGGEIGIGYKFYNWSATLSLDENLLKNATISNYFFGANYYLDEQVYIGGIAGQSIFEWSTPPVKNSIKEDKNQVKNIFGFELGMDHPIYHKNFSLYTKYQFLYLNHKTKVNGYDSAIEHKIQNGFGIGVKYGF